MDSNKLRETLALTFPFNFEQILEIFFHFYPYPQKCSMSKKNSLKVFQTIFFIASFPFIMIITLKKKKKNVLIEIRTLALLKFYAY